MSVGKKRILLLSLFTQNMNTLNTVCRYGNMIFYKKVNLRWGVIAGHLCCVSSVKIDFFLKYGGEFEILKSCPSLVLHHHIKGMEILKIQFPCLCRNNYFQGVSFPYGPVNDMRGVFNDEQVQHNELDRSVQHPTIGPMRVVGPAVKYSQSYNDVRGPPPTLGQHTDSVLQVSCYNSLIYHYL